MSDLDYPDAPAIGGDAYEVAEWLRKVIAYHAAADHPEDELAVRQLLEEFKLSNPEVA